MVRREGASEVIAVAGTIRGRGIEAEGGGGFISRLVTVRAQRVETMSEVAGV